VLAVTICCPWKFLINFSIYVSRAPAWAAAWARACRYGSNACWGCCRCCCWLRCSPSLSWLSWLLWPPCTWHGPWKTWQVQAWKTWQVQAWKTWQVQAWKAWEAWWYVQEVEVRIVYMLNHDSICVELFAS